MKYDNLMDAPCIPICDKLNEFHGIRTYESCCGHCIESFKVFFECFDLYSLQIIARSLDRRYLKSEKRFIIELLTSDTGDTKCAFYLHSVEPYDSQEQMNKDISSIINNLTYWNNETFKNYFKIKQQP